MAGSFQLNSTQTAIAIIPPKSLTTSIQNLRSVHDKAYLKWPPHFNILYPSVPSSQLPAAIQLLRESLASEPLARGRLHLSIEEVGSFRHRKNATVFLKLNAESEERVKRLRGQLCNALCRDESEGTVDGEFRPHLTIGQAGLHGNAIDKLKDQAVRCLEGLQWNCTQLAVLRRNSSGNMEVVEVISLEDGKVEKSVAKDATEFQNTLFSPPGWDSCFHLSQESWIEFTSMPQNYSTDTNMLIATFNIMSEDLAPAFEKRLHLIEEELSIVFDEAGQEAKILCLQEVDEEMLPILLDSQIIQNHFPFCSHSPKTVLPSIRNMIILSSIPFRHFNLQFPERHKSALLANFSILGLTVVNVHLSRSLTNESVRIRKRQMDIITDFLMQNKMLKSAILAGDFNTTTSSSTIQTAIDKKLITRETAELLPLIINTGRWKDAFVEFDDKFSDLMEENLFPGEEGATFDRIHNPLAAASPSPIDNRPQRYDRILFNGGLTLKVSDFGYFAKPETDDDEKYISDHYGVYALLHSSTQVQKLPNLQEPSSKHIEFEPISIVEDNFDVQSLLEPFMPSAEVQSQREKTLLILQLALNDTTKKTFVFPLGSQAMDTYFADSDIDILVIGIMDPSWFPMIPSYLTERIVDQEVETPRGILINSLVQILEVVINNVKVDMQYCYAEELIRKHLSEPSKPLEELMFDSSLVSNLPPVCLRPLNTLRDTLYLRNTIPQYSSFKTAHRFLSLYLRRHGLYSAKFGYLGGIHLTLMLNRVIKLMNAQISRNSSSFSKSFTPATIIRTFFHYYATFSWSRNVVEDPEFRQPNGMQYPSRSGTKEPVVIRALHLPTARSNVAESCTALSAQTFTASFRAAAGKLLAASDTSSKDAAWKWCLREPESSVSDFLSLHLELNTAVSRNQDGCFVRIRIEMWDLEQQCAEDVRHFVGGIESKMPGLLVGLSKAGGTSGKLSARVWPARFWIPEKQNSNTEDHSTSLVGYYLAGVTARFEDEDEEFDSDNVDDMLQYAEESAASRLDAIEDQKAKKPHNPGGSLSSVLMSKVISAARDYERTVSSLRAVKSTSAWVEVDVVERKKVWDMGLALDSRDWTKSAGATGSRQKSTTRNGTNGSGGVTRPAISVPLRNKVKTQSAAVTQGQTSKKSLRPIQDILSRVQWDPTYDVEDFLIGYEDRFDGVKEMPMTSWKSETTDEEFIPLHRVVWVRKRGEEKVWDRRLRYDAIFGSGTGVIEE